MGKYEPLSVHLGAQPISIWRVEFALIEGILGFELPKSARRHAAWWSNNPTGHSHCRAWIDAGWETQDVDLAGEKVTFRKVGASGKSEPLGASRASLFGCLSGTVQLRLDVDLTDPTGETWAAEEGRLHE